MDKAKRRSILTAGTISICLLMGASVALAEEVCVDGDTVTGIKGLEVFTDQYGNIAIDVDFTYTTGFDVYGSSLNGFPFNTENAEEDAFAAMLAINTLLDADPPLYAGQTGQSVYFIGAERDTTTSETLIAATGSENAAGKWWDPCTRANTCVAGVAVLQADQSFVYADLSAAVAGATCDDGSGPPLTFNITPGISGSWFDPTRNNEGYNIEIIGTTVDPQMLAYFYTYDDVGNQMWVFAQGPFSGDTATLPAIVTSGAVFGPGFDTEDVVLEEWGTLTFKFTSCSEGTLTYNSTLGFGSGTYNIVRLSSIIGLECP